MKSEATNSRPLDVAGNGRKSDQEIFNSVLRRWQQRFGYWSILAAVPALVISQVQAPRTGEAKPAEASVTGRTPRLRERLRTGYSTRAMLKRQSQFRLPRLAGDGNLSPLGGLDDCPGRAIPGGTYTAAAPYVDSGDTTGANNTVSSFYMYSFGYQTRSSVGPDHVYSFTLTSRGPNPQIQVSTTSGAYQPVIYILQGGSVGDCPSGTEKHVYNGLMPGDSASGVVTINSQRMNWLPLNVPLHLFVDSEYKDTPGFGSYTLRIQDVTIAPGPGPNQIDDTEFFVRQHYRDFLSREADPEGLAFWTNQITSCGGNPQCIEVNRINESGAFFLSIEFQETGYLVYRFYKTAFGNLPGAPVPIRFNEFQPDTQKIAENVIVKQSGWEQRLESNKLAFATEFVQRARFVSAYPTSMSSAQFVDALFANSEVTPSTSDRNAAISEFSFHATTNDVAARARVLRRVAEHPIMVRQEFPRAFVLMQYFGYFRRNPNDAPDGNFNGHNFWLDKLNSFNGDFIAAEMVKAFISSSEYRRRFGQ